ncbi:hypothetical protein KIPB_008821, partial [Kipferlia bialata]
DEWELPQPNPSSTRSRLVALETKLTALLDRIDTLEAAKAESEKVKGEEIAFTETL